MKRLLSAPTICSLCNFPTRRAVDLFINGRSWLQACPTCDAQHGGVPQIDPSSLPPAAEIVIPASAGGSR